MKKLEKYLVSLKKDGKINQEEYNTIVKLAKEHGMFQWTDGAKNGYYR